MRIVGDVHQEYAQYLQIINDAEYSLQVGDLGFDYTPLANLDVTKHRAIQGNHDNYDSPHPIFLGDYGTYTVEDKTIFYVRGAWSIDRKYRRFKVDWFPNEELSYTELSSAIELYHTTKPNIVITHECPLEIVQFVTNPNFVYDYGYSDPIIKTRTNLALQAMLDTHKPALWIFGHYHTRKEVHIKGTTFICLDEIRQIPNNPAFIDI